MLFLIFDFVIEELSNPYRGKKQNIVESFSE
jgi:hypothetical protein